MRTVSGGLAGQEEVAIGVIVGWGWSVTVVVRAGGVVTGERMGRRGENGKWMGDGGDRDHGGV